MIIRKPKFGLKKGGRSSDCQAYKKIIESY